MIQLNQLNHLNNFGGIKMQSKLMKKSIKLSRIFVSLTVFIILNAWFLFENDPQWIFSIIVSAVVFFFSFPNSKVCKFIINNGDKIKNKLLRLLFYALGLPIIFIILIFIVMLLCALVVELFFSTDSISLGTAVLIAFTGVGILTCTLVPYYQTIIILVIRYFLSLKNNNNK